MTAEDEDELAVRVGRLRSARDDELAAVRERHRVRLVEAERAVDERFTRAVRLEQRRYRRAAGLTEENA